MKPSKLIKTLLGALLLAVIVLSALLFVVNKKVNSPYFDTSTEAVELTDIGGAYKIWFSRLSNEGKHAYNYILRSIYSMPEEIEINRIDSDTLDEVFYAILSDNPDLFFIGRKCTLRTAGRRTFFSVEYTMDKADYPQAKAKLDSACADIVATFSDTSDLWQTELEIHDYIVDNCDYSLEDEILGASSYGALVDKKAACEGYSKAAKMLLDAAGIENSVVTGKAENENGENVAHMWNVVKLGGEWYHLDCTWDDPVSDDGLKMKSHLYFNIDDESISHTHSEFSYDYGCNSMQESYFAKSGAYFESYSRANEAEIAEILIKEVKNGKDTVYLCFADKETFDAAVEDLLSNERIYHILKVARDNSDIRFSTIKTGYITDEERLIFAVAPQF